MLDPDLIRFVQGPVMILMARGRSGRAVIARGQGCSVSPEGELIVQIATRQWAEALEGLSPGEAVALTFVRPSDYRALQVKGPLVACDPPSADAQSRAAAYRQAMSAELLRLGVSQPQADQWIGCEPVQALRLRPSAVFEQTPRDGAGRLLASAAS